MLKVADLPEKYTKEIEAFLAKPNMPSTYEDYEDFQFLIIRRLEIAEDALAFLSQVFIFKDNAVFQFDRDNYTFVKLAAGMQTLLSVLEKQYMRNQKIIGGYGDEISELEEKLFERSVPSYFMDIWFDLRKDLTKIDNFYYRNSSVYKEFFKNKEVEFGTLKDEYQDIDDMISYQISTLVYLKSRMDSLHHYYDSIKSDRLNKTLYALTLISAVFLPLNLIVGFFGMNTQGLFMADDPNATNNVVITLVAIVAILILGVPVIKFFDEFILRKILGRYDFYKKMTGKITKIEDHLRL